MRQKHEEQSNFLQCTTYFDVKSSIKIVHHGSSCKKKQEKSMTSPLENITDVSIL